MTIVLDKKGELTVMRGKDMGWLGRRRLDLMVLAVGYDD